MVPDASLELPAAIFDRSLERLERLVASSSASGDRAGLERVARQLGEELTARGWHATIDWRAPEPGEPELPVLRARRGEGSRPLLLLGHLDTVLPALAPRRIEERLVATGAIDMKGGFAALLGALDLLAARGAAPPHLELVAVPDEEVGGALSRQLTRERGAEARALWVLEPGELAGEGETLVLGRRGLFDWRVSVRGRAAHSGLAFWQGRSAVAAAAKWAARAAELSEPGAGPTVNVARLVAGDSAFVGDLAAAATLVGSGRQLNVVGDRASLEGEARFLTLRDAERTDEALRRAAAEIAEREEVELDYRRGLSIPPVEPTPRGREVAALAVGAARARGWTLEVEEERGGVSFPNFLPDPASLPVLDGLGPAGGGMHTREEWVSLRSLARRIVLLADLLQA